MEGSRLLTVRQRVREGLRCVYCHDEVAARERVACASGCGASYHGECWEELPGGCAIPGCGFREARRVGHMWRWRRALRLLLAVGGAAGGLSTSVRNVASHVDRVAALVLSPLLWASRGPGRSALACGGIFAGLAALNSQDTPLGFTLFLFCFAWAFFSALLTIVGPALQGLVFALYSGLRLLIVQPLGWLTALLTLQLGRLARAPAPPLAHDPLPDAANRVAILTVVGFAVGLGVYGWRLANGQPPWSLRLFDDSANGGLEALVTTVGTVTILPLAVTLLVAAGSGCGRGLLTWADAAVSREQRLLRTMGGAPAPRPRSSKG